MVRFLQDKFPEYQRYNYKQFNKILESICDLDPDLSIWDSENSVCEKNQDPDWTYRAIAKRKTVKMIRKETKNVKTVTVTQGDDEEYDIEDVLKKLEVSEVPTEKSKRKKKKKGKKKNSAETDVNNENPDQGDQDQLTLDQGDQDTLFEKSNFCPKIQF